MVSCSECHSPEDEERKLKTLSCGHAYCLFCLFLVTKNQQGRMPCPKCRQETLESMIADSRYQQLSGAICLRHGDPVTLYCLTCCSVVCRICTMLEHRSTHGHILVDKKEKSETRFRDLFGALDRVTSAQRHLSGTSAAVLKVLKRNVDVTQREIRDNSDRILDKGYAEFRDFLDSELSKLGDLVRIITDVQKRAAAASSDFTNVSTNLKTAIDSEEPARISGVDYTRYIERPYGMLVCEPVRETERLSVVLATPPSHFPDWLGIATGVLWVLPKQLLLVVDERYDEGEEVCIYSFNANDLTKVDWTYSIKPAQSGVKSVLCQDVYRHLTECWIWIASGDEIFQLSLDLQKDGCPIKGKRALRLQLPTQALGMSAIACQFGESYVDNQFLVTTESMTNSLLSLYGWNGEHQEDIALGRLSRSITDIALRPMTSLVIMDAEAAIARSYHHDTFSSRDQCNFTLHMGNTGPSKDDPAVPISATCNKNGDLLIMWMLPELRKGDIIYSSWNVTAHEQDTSGGSGRIFVIAAGNSLETGIPVGVSCWDHDVAVCFQDGKIRILKNFPILNDSANKWAGHPGANRQKQRRSRQQSGNASQELRRSQSLLAPKVHNMQSARSKMRRGDTINFV